MFKITPIQDAGRRAAVAEACADSPLPCTFAYEMTDCESGAIMGIAQFDIEDGAGRLFSIKEAIGSHDTEAMFILGRATLNFIDLCGIHTCLCAKEAGDAALLHAVGFRSERDGLLFCDMTGMFDGHCSGEAVKL